MLESEVERHLESLNNASEHVRRTIPFSAQPDNTISKISDKKIKKEP